MKKLIVALSVGALMMGTSALAESENAAWITNNADEVVCGWHTPVGSMNGLVHIVQTKSGNTKYICNGELTYNEPPEKVVKGAGFDCTIISRTAGLVVTTDTRACAH